MAKVLSVEVKGDKEVIAKLAAYSLNATRAMANALYEEAQGLITEAKEETPKDTGALRSSGHVELPQIEGTKVTVEAGFGGAAVDYAIYVHEDLEAYHTNGKAKYLEDPLNRRSRGMDDRIAEKMRRQLGA